jgi:hypothetical protein
MVGQTSEGKLFMIVPLLQVITSFGVPVFLDSTLLRLD